MQPAGASKRAPSNRCSRRLEWPIAALGLAAALFVLAVELAEARPLGAGEEAAAPPQDGAEQNERLLASLSESVSRFLQTTGEQQRLAAARVIGSNSNGRNNNNNNSSSSSSDDDDGKDQQQVSAVRLRDL